MDAHANKVNNKVKRGKGGRFVPANPPRRDVGYWLCPACGCDESFEGTIHTKKAGSSVGFVREVEGVPILMGKSHDGGVQEVTVRKCKNCKEVLGAKDYIKPRAEVEAEKKRTSRLSLPPSKTGQGGTGCLFVLTCIIAFLTVGCVLGVALR